LGLVGESGCGKTTTARILVRLLEPTAGEVWLDGESLMEADPARLRELRIRLQLVFQDSAAALNPRLTVEASVGEGLQVSKAGSRAERRARVADMLRRVGLDPDHYLARHPHELSGGQRQRVGIARALVVRPCLVVCDEAVSSLDVSVQAQIVNLLRRLQEEDGHAYVVISHDLSVVRHLCDRVAVMYLGRIVEIGSVEALYGAPHHPYTRALLEAVPVLDASRRGTRTVLAGEPPSPVDPPRGCRFHPRCPRAFDRCRLEDPPPVDVRSDHRSWCFLPVGHGGGA
jgi:oligopeptide/dipeptide ABC transporter ATP-binding protein